MFHSFFPRPRAFFLSALLLTACATLFWFTLGDSLGRALGFDIVDGAEPVIGLGFFVTPDFLWFYLYYWVLAAVFSLFWFRIAPHKWQIWSVFGTTVLVFTVYFDVQVAVAINYWQRPFFDTIQNALANAVPVSPDVAYEVARDLYRQLLVFSFIAFVAVFVGVMTSFFTEHYVFRWRNSMNDYYLGKWKKLRKVEGAAQRVQEDTRDFAEIMQTLGLRIIEAIMTLISFLPILFMLSQYIKEIPVFGEIAHALFWSALLWSSFGTALLLVAGIKLPGLHFRNQRVEAAFRKELVYGEDDAKRAQPITVRDLFNNVRRNYFRLYFHYMYFNVVRNGYFQADIVFVYFLLIPAIAVVAITYGIMQQIVTAFNRVSSSFQYLVRSWETIVKLMSIRKRLVAFENALEGKPLPELDEDFVKGKDAPY